VRVTGTICEKCAWLGLDAPILIANNHTIVSEIWNRLLPGYGRSLILRVKLCCNQNTSTFAHQVTLLIGRDESR